MATGGHVALLRKSPTNAGMARVAISRAFTKAWTASGRPLEEAFAIHDRLADHIAAMWTTAHANTGANWIGKRAGKVLVEWCEEAGFAPAGKAARKVFAVPRRMAEKSKANIAVHRMKTDAAGHYNASPFRRSNLSLLRPMEVLMGDVHNIDVKTLREDGSGAWCIKMITWMDVGTRRAWVDLKTCKSGEAVRRGDVNASLASVFKHPDWGSPDHLWVDNGPEYKLLDGLTEPLGRGRGRGCRPPVIRSTPYNARAKGLIEGFFGRFERGWLSLLPGYSGGDRMKTPTANQGKALAPLNAPPAVVENVIRRMVDAYNDEPQDALQGQSPNEAFAARSAEFEAVTWSVEALAYALANRDERTVIGGQVQIKNRFYDVHGPAMAPGTKVDVLHGPFIQGGVLIEYAGSLEFAEDAPVFGPLDVEGSKYAAARRREFKNVIKGLAAGLPAVNPLAEAVGDRQPSIDLLAGQRSTVQLAISPKARKEQEQAADAELRARNAEVDAILSGSNRNSTSLRVA